MGNIAHDYIINDILREELRRDPPLEGLNLPQARDHSFEQLMVDLSKQGTQGRRCWSGGSRSKRRVNLSDPRSDIARAMEDAGLVERPPQGAGWAHEVKFDGYRLQMRIEAGAARLYTRKGLDWTDKFPEIAATGAVLPDAIVDGEVAARRIQIRVVGKKDS